ncbi:type II toxin-antitoxin system ParD family antitoxin [Novosphingobium sp. Gsoil 351]|uniref:ribbon-helix-helix domain-containing protein n=1 Tax=Novosphingobium sp. Gsoil 351 TaxID=2675225 RepID=UPI0012B444B4|nr:type II toxin-antitoxin system ParD family antitoxin [Novosphingobium sp. Gsoil 351]QGN55143.1 type II toxin-antitoxin system ParD family antitoxin [Novosphingobium sp. Gsoil 351]
MGEISFPSEIRQWIASRVTEGGYADEDDYVLELIRRDMADASLAETPEQIAWVREKVAEGLASGIAEGDPRTFIEKLIAKRRATRG